VRSIPLGATDVPPIDNSHQFVTAAQQRSALAYEWADAALRVLAAAGQPISFPAVADAAGVSKAYLYAQRELRARIVEARTAGERQGMRRQAPA